MKENFTIRLTTDLRARFEALRVEKMEREKRFVPLSEVVVDALEYGIDVVEQDIFSEISLPRKILSKKQQLLAVASQVFEKGLERLQPTTSN